MGVYNDRKDDYAFFISPVDPTRVPGYADVIKHPMDFGTMSTKVARGKYRSLEEFTVSTLSACSDHSDASTLSMRCGSRALREEINQTSRIDFILGWFPYRGVFYEAIAEPRTFFIDRLPPSHQQRQNVQCSRINLSHGSRPPRSLGTGPHRQGIRTCY
jgi:hypothetical protein